MGHWQKLRRKEALWLVLPRLDRVECDHILAEKASTLDSRDSQRMDNELYQSNGTSENQISDRL